MNSGEIDFWAATIRENVCESFDKDGYATFCALLLVMKNPETGEPLPDPATVPIVPFGGVRDSREKAGFAEIVRQVVKKTDALAVLFITEAWMAGGWGEDVEKLQRKARNVGGVSNMPERKEALLITYCRRGSIVEESWVFPIERSEERVCLGPMLPVSSISDGTLSDLMNLSSVN